MTAKIGVLPCWNDLLQIYRWESGLASGAGAVPFVAKAAHGIWKYCKPTNH